MKKHIVRIAGSIIAVSLMTGILSGCTDNSYEKDLESGRQKYYSGQPMTKGEYDAVKNFNKWKSSQGSKTYDQWGK
ncbi:MAG: hypothetical protein MSH58_08050 [Clostridiales bacterium]|nr:hypothetical protein [Clostridiales bacterium]